jgi:hypothetical protein
MLIRLVFIGLTLTDRCLAFDRAFPVLIVFDISSVAGSDFTFYVLSLILSYLLSLPSTTFYYDSLYKIG